METEKVLRLYDEGYAGVYDDRFIHIAGYRHIANFEIELLGNLLADCETWLDVACGTGYFLSKFNNSKRAGIDLSPDMLKVARSRNPNALFFKQMDFRHQNHEFEGKWELTTSMWGAYCYVESMTEVDQFIKNLCDWTTEEGICFLSMVDVEDVLYGRQPLQHCNPNVDVFGGPLNVNGVIWSYVDTVHNKKHENLIATHIEYVIEQFEKVFRRVDIVHYPPYPSPIPGQRRGLIATGKSGKLSGRATGLLDRIKEVSENNRRLELKKSLSSQESPQERRGWLRKVWGSTPRSLRSIIRKIIGD